MTQVPSMRPPRFEGQVVVITGAARGIGFATAQQAMAEGATVVITDRDPSAVAEAVQRLNTGGGQANGVSGDVSDPEHVRAHVAEIMEKCGRIDVLINNAAINTYEDSATMTAEVWNRELAVCLSGPFFWAQSVAVRAMIPEKRGAIVNIGSGAALAAIPGCVAYVAAKHGVVGLTKSLAIDWGQHNIRVNCVCPGLTFTELAKASAEVNPEAARQRELRIPTGRGAQPDDIANAILFLASKEADAISGVALSVDGGTLALSSGYTAPRGGCLTPKREPDR